MKKFKFEHEYKEWDRYRAFHKIDGGIVEFDTGEVMVPRWIHSDFRQTYDKYGIQIVATTDKECPRLYLDKECTKLVKKAWVTHHGMQELAIDHEQNVAVVLKGRQYLAKPVYLGKHVHHASAYWSGAGRLPVPLGTIKVQTPDAEYKKVLSPIILNEVIPTITAMHKMDNNNSGYGHGKYMANREWLDSSAEEIIADICNTTEWSLSQNLKQIALHGFEYPRSTQLVDYLYTKGEK